MPRKNRKTGKARRRHRLLASPTPELVAALSLLGASLRITEVAKADEPSALSSGVKLKLAQYVKMDTEKSQTNTLKEKTQSNTWKRPQTNTWKDPQTNTWKDPQANSAKVKSDTVKMNNSIKWQPTKTQTNENLKK